MTGFVLFGVILVVLVATIIWAAIRGGEDTGAALAPAERRDAAIEALRDLELEYRTGKLTPEEYETVRARLEREAVTARNEAAGGEVAAGPGRTAHASSEPRGKAACPACEHPLEGGEAFCPACGLRLESGV